MPLWLSWILFAPTRRGSGGLRSRVRRFDSCQGRLFWVWRTPGRVSRSRHTIQGHDALGNTAIMTARPLRSVPPYLGRGCKVRGRAVPFQAPSAQPGWGYAGLCVLRCSRLCRESIGSCAPMQPPDQEGLQQHVLQQRNCLNVAVGVAREEIKEPKPVPRHSQQRERRRGTG